MVSRAAGKAAEKPVKKSEWDTLPVHAGCFNVVAAKSSGGGRTKKLSPFNKFMVRFVSDCN